MRMDQLLDDAEKGLKLSGSGISVADGSEVLVLEAVIGRTGKTCGWVVDHCHV
jgi:hypothetical protein